MIACNRCEEMAIVRIQDEDVCLSHYEEALGEIRVIVEAIERTLLTVETVRIAGAVL